MRLPITQHPRTTPIPSHIQALADSLMAGAQSRFGHGVWSMNAGDGGNNGGDGGGGDGGSGDGGGDNGGAGGAGGQGQGDGGQGGGDQGRDLGFPANTPVAEMTEGQQAAYWRNESKKHQGRYNTLTGGRSYDETKADLDAYAEVKKSQQTPAEQALAERYEQGKKDAATESSAKAATAILRANLQSRLGATGLTGEALQNEINDVLDVIDVRKFIAEDGDVDTDRLVAAANRFGGSTTTTTRRDFGGGRRHQAGGGGTGKGRGESEADKRFGAKNQQQ